VVHNPFDPRAWGIDPATAQTLGSLAGPALPRQSRGRFSGIVPPKAIRALVPQIDQLALAADRGGWYWETRPPHPAFRRFDDVRIARKPVNSWTPRDDLVLTEQWPASLDAVVDGFVELFQSQWSAAVAVTPPESNPVAAFVRDLVGSGKVEMPSFTEYTREQLISYKIYNALDRGVFNVTVARRGWEFPTARSCCCCGARHYYDLARYYLIRDFGIPGICPPCMVGARYGLRQVDFDRDSILGALRHLSKLTGLVPDSHFRDRVVTAGMDDHDRGAIVALMLAIPEPPEVLRVVGCADWLEVLKTAGIVGPEGWRPSRGTICIAHDGHPCRSLAEKTICDWMHRHRVAHTIEPSWPADVELNPSGRLRADWLVGDTYIEFAGLLHDTSYREKMIRKQ
jgi:hypothetical protein